MEPSKAFAFPDIYSAVESILEKLSVQAGDLTMVETAPFAYGLKIMLGQKELAAIGLLDDKILKQAEVRQEVWYADLNWDLLCKKATGLKKFEEISKFLKFAEIFLW